GEHIIETSRLATIEAIGKLKKGSYKNSLTMDGYDRPLTLAAEMSIGEEGIHVDFTGTSPASAFGINVVLNYTTAYTAFGVKCLVAPEVPNNAGSLAPITVSAPEGCPRHQAVQHRDLPLRRCRCAARQGRARRDRLSERGTHHPGRSDRGGGARPLPAARVPRGLGWCRTLPRRSRPDYRVGRHRR